MSHKEQTDFIKNLKSKYQQFFIRKKVLEIGSLNINGTIRDLFYECDYIGIDLDTGPGVDIICEGQNYNAPDESYDVVVSTECFEHNPYWYETFLNMIRLCKPEGLVVFTCATEGREEHGTTNRFPSDSPFTISKGWNYYKNLTENDFIEKIDFSKEFDNYSFSTNNEVYDLYFCGIKKSKEKYENRVDNKMKITLYAICKNEEKNVEKFIENSKKFSHTIVVDTGSTDNTVELLKEAGIEVYYHPQSKEEFDFSKVRNQALSYVKTDWAFSLDFNENVDDFFPEGFEVIEKEFTNFKHLRFDDDGNGEPKQSFEVHTRFHRTKNYTWQNAVHETPVFVSTEDYPEEVSVDTSVKITKKINKSISKELFYLDICEREYQKDPTNWYYIWFIFNHYFSIQNYTKALEFGQEFLNVTKPYFDTFRITAFIKCSICLIQLQDVTKAANYSFHAVSEAMNMGEPYLSEAFSHLNQVAKMLNNPNITIFATGFNGDTLQSPERYEAIKKLMS